MRHPSHNWKQDDDGVTYCKDCDVYPYDSQAQDRCPASIIEDGPNSMSETAR